MDRLDRRELDRVVGELDRIYAQLDRIEIDDQLVRRAGVLAQEHGLRSYDAVHLAAAERVTAPDVVFVAGDRDLCLAAGSLSLNVAPLT